ncbi:MAG: hypothetical protein NAG76_11865 [Candidatus Pristimantibacillus lignocellulolyticus]|uniref:Uncharacterized protein n=1 Tax=Candidatus Pristimantibacillus lignocellulolyticus TaxID=2994561 RepID=A0A9J6Z992_9BACL|nr:MAG: hypothetical protein NAG76_11865 [Candidatus Pristimantibacillus lignocellulolyticus]
MSYWQGVRYLVQQDIKNARWKNLTFIVFILYVALFTYTSFIGAVVEGIELDSLITEYLLLIVFSGIGLIATHLYTIGDMKRDLLAERLIYWRTLPIKQDQLVWSRIIGVTFYSILSILIYYVLMIMAMVLTDVSFEPLPLLLHALQLLAISLVLNFALLYCEMVFSLKIYSIICWTYPILFLALVVLYYGLADYSLLHGLDVFARQQPLIVLIVSIVIIIASIFIAHKMITPKFRKRNI